MLRLILCVPKLCVESCANSCANTVTSPLLYIFFMGYGLDGFKFYLMKVRVAWQVITQIWCGSVLLIFVLILSQKQQSFDNWYELYTFLYSIDIIHESYIGALKHFDGSTSVEVKSQSDRATLKCFSKYLTYLWKQFIGSLCQSTMKMFPLNASK